jgi:hypothetical protein
MLSPKYIARCLVIASILPIVWSITGNAVWVLAFVMAGFGLLGSADRDTDRADKPGRSR